MHMAKKNPVNSSSRGKLLLVGGIIALTGIVLLLVVNAASRSIAIESEQASLVGTVQKCDDHIVFANSCDGGGGDGFPTNHAEAVAVIKNNPSVRETILKLEFPSGSIVEEWDLHNRPQRYTPSAALVRDDYIWATGERDAGQNDGRSVAHIACSFSHFSYDDPIVAPGQPGAAHLHMYFGNTHANAFSTHDTLINEGSSTCQHGELNRTAYWMPALMDGDDNALIPNYTQVYYERVPAVNSSSLVTFPEGLNFIIGDSGATSPQATNFGVKFFCGYYDQAINNGGGSRGSYSATIPSCNKGSYSHFQIDIDSPYCWNGVLDWSASAPNVVYPLEHYYSGVCPSSHPKPLPFLKYRLAFDINVSPTPTSTWYLSSDINPADGSIKTDRGITLHADWYGGWHRDTIERLTDDCMRRSNAWCDRQHMGDGGLVTVPAREGNYNDRRFSPQELVKLCPLRDGYDGQRQHVAYCKAAGHGH